MVIVPTTYADTPTEVFAQAGFSLVIWANHLLRSSVVAMQRLAATVYRAESVQPVSGEIASIQEVFRLQNADELRQAEERYLPKRRQVEGPRQPEARRDWD